MPTLQRAGWPVSSVFALHGRDENDLSGAFAYALAHSSVLLRSVVTDIYPDWSPQLEDVTLHVQTARRHLGITDIEIRVADQALIVLEAKTGGYPETSQLLQYAAVCSAANLSRTCIVALTSLSPGNAPIP